MNILITGYKGFIGKNLIEILNNNNPNNNLLLFDKDNSEKELMNMCKKCDVVFHLAAIIRPTVPADYDINISLTSKLLRYLVIMKNTCPVMFASSIQVFFDNPYAECKRIEEQMILDYGSQNNIPTYIFRFPNLFGKYSRPNYTSVISTFCYNTSHNLPITVNNPSTYIHFAYVQDILTEVIHTVLINSNSMNGAIIDFDTYSTVSLGELAYYMGTLKNGLEPKIKRNDSFYVSLQDTYKWFAVDYEKWNTVGEGK